MRTKPGAVAPTESETLIFGLSVRAAFCFLIVPVVPQGKKKSHVQHSHYSGENACNVPLAMLV